MNSSLLEMLAAATLAAGSQFGSSWIEEAPPFDLVISRLEACVFTGAQDAPKSSLGDAVVAVRALCLPQIKRAYAASDARVDAENPRAATDTSDDLRAKARRRIDLDLIALVSSQTGLSQ